MASSHSRRADRLAVATPMLVSAAPFADRRLVVVLNRFDPSIDVHRRNLAWLRTREGLEVVTDPEALAELVR